MWERADTEDKTMPSTEALKLHWNRSLWVLEMWHQATSNDIDLPGKSWNINFSNFREIIKLFKI